MYTGVCTALPIRHDIARRSTVVRYAVLSIVVTSTAPACGARTELFVSPYISSGDSGPCGPPPSIIESNVVSVSVSQASQMQASVSVFRGAPPMTARGNCVIWNTDSLDSLHSNASAGVVTLAGVGVIPYDTTIAFMLAPGQTLDVRATGADAPAFSGTIHIPSPITIDQPFEGLDGSVPTVHSANGLAASWQAAVSTCDFVQVNAAVVGSGIHAWSCRFPVGAGHGFIPADVLTAIPHGRTTVWANLSSITVLRIAGWDIFLGGTVPLGDGGMVDVQ